MGLVDSLYYGLGAYSLFLTILGTILNSCILFVCTRKELRKITTFVFISFMSMTDTCSLYIWNLDHYWSPYYNFNLEFISLFWCKFSVFIQFTSLQWSSWLLVFMSVDRLLSVSIKLWRIKYFSSKKAAFLCLGIGVVVVLVNFHLLISNGYVDIVNGTETVECYSSTYYEIFPLWTVVHSFIATIVPFFILIVVNILLIRQIKQMRNHSSLNQSESRDNKQASMNKTVIVMTILFFILTLPSGLVSVCLNSVYPDTVDGQVILAICDSITFSYYAYSFFVLLFSNKQFRRYILKVLHKNKVSGVNS